MKKRIFILIIILYNCSSVLGQKNDSLLKDSLYKLLDSVNVFNGLGRFKESIDYTNNALELSKILGDQELTIKSQRKLAEIYSRMGNPEKGISTIESLIEKIKETNYKKELADLYCLLALSYKELKKYDNVEYYLNISFESSKKIKYKKGQWVALINLGILNYSRKKYEKAHTYFETSILYLDPDHKMSISFPFYFAVTKIELGDYINAKKYLDKAYKISQGNINNLKTMCLTYVKLYEKQNNLTEAISWYKKYVEYETTYHKELNKNKEETLQLKYDLEIKDKQIQIANKEKEIREGKIKTSRMIIYFITFLLISFLFTIFFLHKGKQKEKSLNNNLKEKNKELLIAKEKVEFLSNIKSNFFSMISHELRTPLYTITGITELLINNNPDKNQKGYLESLKFAGNHLISLINNILQNNKIEKKELKINSQSFNLKEIINNTLSAFEYYANKSNNKLHIDFDNSIPEILYGDVIKLSQVLNNLLSNAMKFTYNGNIWITVKKEINSDDKYFFSVKDDGIGINIDKQKILFDDLIQESLDFDNKYEGSGLGLQISKKLLKILGSNIKVNSQINNGSEFYFTISFKEYFPVKKSENDLEKISKKGLLTDIKVMVIDDNKINLILTKKILENSGIQVTIFENPIKAIEKIKEKKFELILMDIHMPPINGYEATKIIREFNKNIPIIALTASSLHDNKERAIKAGMNDFINKPYVQKEFFEIISKYIKT
ncbi:tetratricopeptide repeat-containing hybrid sensor histidine kinase/response regulator [Aquimarina muelleri]|uniref:histidine kinase n=1 Tax=Aquimarina muelleri TaxID=279356 RepID=A0A918JVB9_9FLAO|nr:response regulator [Aquimarina muelleri]MCX2762999.1 response regulator [Aquimarina muelleri]GGX15347.1 histidine kinase [Aquimarina muelleri]